jgi:hypothetical protein
MLAAVQHFVLPLNFRVLEPDHAESLKFAFRSRLATSFFTLRKKQAH